MKKYLSIILGIILTACLVGCGSSDRGTLNDNEQAIISNQEVSDTEEQELSVENRQTEKDADFEQKKEQKARFTAMQNLPYEVKVKRAEIREIQEKLQMYWRRKLKLTFLKLSRRICIRQMI